MARYEVEYWEDEETKWIHCDIFFKVFDDGDEDCVVEKIGSGYYYNKMGAFINAWTLANLWLRDLTIAMGEFEDEAWKKLRAESYWMGCGE